jgi:hypothetical protein
MILTLDIFKRSRVLTVRYHRLTVILLMLAAMNGLTAVVELRRTKRTAAFFNNKYCRPVMPSFIQIVQAVSALITCRMTGECDENNTRFSKGT